MRRLLAALRDFVAAGWRLVARGSARAGGGVR